MLRSYKELIVWQKAYRLCILVYEYTKEFPKEEKYGLASQMRRAVVSIPSNLAEGYCRKHRKEYLNFINIAFGSGAELETQTELSIDFGFNDAGKGKAILCELEEIQKMINGLYQSLKNPKPKWLDPKP